MSGFVTYDGDGNIVSKITGQTAEQAALNVPEGQSLLEVGPDIDVAEYKVKNRKLVKLPPKPVDVARLLADLRMARNRRLAASDWTQLADAQVDKNAWGVYRQQLRDLPATASDAENPNWPDVPTNAHRRFER